MKLKHLFCLLLAAMMLFVCVSCSDNDKKADSTDIAGNADSTGDSAKQFKTVYESENISLDDAYDMLVDVTPGSYEDSVFFEMLSELKNCSGRFLQKSGSTGNTYTADVAFYLAHGKVYCSIDYTGYMGELSDGSVSETTKSGYLFESFPKGDLYGREQDFTIYFGKEQLYIAWADDIEYTLTRGDGSTDDSQEHKGTIAENGLLDTITEVIDNNFADYPHRVVFDEEESMVCIYIQGVDNTRLYLTLGDPSVMAAWQTLTDNAATLSQTIYDALQVGNYADYAFIFYVDELSAYDYYTEDDILLCAGNGMILYNYADEID